MTVDSPTSETRNRRRLLMAAAAVVVVIGVAGIALANNNTDDDQTPSPPAAATIAPTTTVAPAMQTVRFTVTSASIPVTFTAPDDWTIEGSAAHKGSGSRRGRTELRRGRQHLRRRVSMGAARPAGWSDR